MYFLEACDILLEQFGQFNHKFVYHGRYNRITFTYKENKFVVSFSIFASCGKPTINKYEN